MSNAIVRVVFLRASRCSGTSVSVSSMICSGIMCECVSGGVSRYWLFLSSSIGGGNPECDCDMISCSRLCFGNL